MDAETTKEALLLARIVFRSRSRLIFGPRFQEDLKSEYALSPPPKSWQTALRRAYERRKEHPADYDLLVAYARECLRRYVLPPQWLSEFLVAHLDGEEIRPKCKGPNKTDLRGRDLALAMAVREVAEEYKLPVKNSTDGAVSAVSIVGEAVKTYGVHASSQTIYRAYRTKWGPQKKNDNPGS